MEFKRLMKTDGSLEPTTFWGSMFQILTQRFLNIYRSTLLLNLALCRVKPLFRVRMSRISNKVSQSMSTNPCNSLKYKDRSDLILRISKDSALRHLSLSGYGMPLRPRRFLVNKRWTDSTFLMSDNLYGDQTLQQYSRMGWTYATKALNKQIISRLKTL